MKPLLNRIWGRKEITEAAKASIPQTLDSLQEHQRVSVVGWIANKLDQQLQEESGNEGVLIYKALQKPLRELDTEEVGTEDYPLYLADKLVYWIEAGEDVYVHIKQMNLESHYHKSLLEVYELIKTNESIYFNRIPPSEKEVSEDDKIWGVYRDVLYASSQRKFLLIKENEVQMYKQGAVICKEPVVEKSDIPKTRSIAKAALEKAGIPREKVARYTLVISEAITNILKHAKDGELTIVKNDQFIHVIIEDTGNGFPLKILPYTILLEGYSTKKSLGQGFTLMLKLANQVLLQTSPEGSTIILVFNHEEGDRV